MFPRTLPLLGVLALALPVAADDWPQWQGPKRDNISAERGLLKQLPRGGPKLVWTFEEAGIGYSGPAIVGDKLYTLGGMDGKEWLFALDVTSGKRLWKTEVGPLFKNGYGGGPRCTPTVDGDRVYAIGGQGNLICADAGSGEQAWQVSLTGDLGGQMMSGWGYSESPLVDGEHVICTPGGGRGALAALNKKNGEVVWRSEKVKDRATYSSVVVSEAAGVRQYVQMLGSGVVGIAAKDGRYLWREDLAVNRVAIIPTPLVKDDLVYVTSDYGSGCGLVKLSSGDDGVKSDVVYQNKVMQNQHGGFVLVDGLVCGWSGNTNGGRGQWTCQDFKTGKMLWESSKFNQAGSVTYADGRLYCYGQNDGTLVLADVNKSGWKEYGRFVIPRHSALPRERGHIWTHPVVANGKLYLRDLDLIFCFDIKASGS